MCLSNLTVLNFAHIFSNNIVFQLHLFAVYSILLKPEIQMFKLLYTLVSCCPLQRQWGREGSGGDSGGHEGMDLCLRGHWRGLWRVGGAQKHYRVTGGLQGEWERCPGAAVGADFSVKKGIFLTHFKSILYYLLDCPNETT